MKVRVVTEFEIPLTYEKADVRDGEAPGQQRLKDEVSRTLGPAHKVLDVQIVPSNEHVRNAFKKMLSWVVENRAALPKDTDYYAAGDEDATFFSEAYLYSLLGKEDARTLLALMRNLMKLLGFDMHQMQLEIDREEQEEEERRQKMQAAWKKRQAEKK